jgi:hypothetical protein
MQAGPKGTFGSFGCAATRCARVVSTGRDAVTNGGAGGSKWNLLLPASTLNMEPVHGAM